MKRVFKRILTLTALMVVTLIAGVFSACEYGPTPEDLTKDKGFTCCVTYDANGGTFGSGVSVTYALVKPESLTPAPGYVDQSTQAQVKIPTRRNYRLVGEVEDNVYKTQSWYLAETDESGSVVYEGEGAERKAVLASDTPWDFTKDKVTEDITLVAQWEEVHKFLLCVKETDSEGKVVEKTLREFIVKPGDTIADKLYKKVDGVLFRRADYIRLSIRNYTLLDFYMDAEFAQTLDLAYTHPGQREVTETFVDPETKQTVEQKILTNDVKIYADYLKGDYDLISNDNIKSLHEGSKWYLLEDVDVSAQNWTCLESFNGEIYGNGFALVGLNLTSNAMKPTGGYKTHSIFGEMNGVVEDLVIKDAKLTVTTQYGATVVGEQRIALLASSFGENGQFKNVTVDNATISLVYSDKFQATVPEENKRLWITAATAEQTVTVVGGDENGYVKIDSDATDSE